MKDSCHYVDDELPTEDGFSLFYLLNTWKSAEKSDHTNKFHSSFALIFCLGIVHDF